MFEAHVLHLLRKYLGEYVHGLSSEALRISVWKGDVVLKDLKLKAEALNSLKLPVVVKAGFVGTITLKVPWKSLGKEPVIVLIDRVFILAHPAPHGRTLNEEDQRKLFEIKLQQIEEAELATLEAISRSKLGNPTTSGNSWLGSLIATIIGNLKISISNVHIRYEDSVSSPGHPFSCGITLAKLAAVTMDEQGNETFDASGALDRLRKTQYHDWIKLLEVVSRYRTHVEFSHLRPSIPVSDDPRLWWRYANQASLQQKKMCYQFSWDQIQRLCQLRRRYVQLYAGSLQNSSYVDTSELREIEKDLDSKVILLWRLLAHAKVEFVKTKEAAQQRRSKKNSWFSFSWRTDSDAEEDYDEDASERQQFTKETLTKEEWRVINNLVSFQPDEELVPNLGKDMQNMVQYMVTISVQKAAARIIDINQTEIVCGRFEQLHVSTKFKSRSTQYDLSLKFYGFSAPEGSLAQSVSSEWKVDALSASFVHSPIGENVDWRLSATISPCHATVIP